MLAQPADVRKKFNADPTLSKLYAREVARLGRTTAASRKAAACRRADHLPQSRL